MNCKENSSFASVSRGQVKSSGLTVDYICLSPVLQSFLTAAKPEISECLASTGADLGQAARRQPFSFPQNTKNNITCAWPPPPAHLICTKPCQWTYYDLINSIPDLFLPQNLIIHNIKVMISQKLLDHWRGFIFLSEIEHYKISLYEHMNSNTLLKMNR